MFFIFLFYSGKPENVQIGIINRHDPLPPSIDGLYMSMLNHTAKKARLTFKLENDELWINTSKLKSSYIYFNICLISGETTKRIAMTQIRNIIDEPIEGHDGYSIIGFQTGTR